MKVVVRKKGETPDIPVVIHTEFIKLQDAMQERKIQEKLRENAFEAFMEEEKARESREIDELTSYTYGQKTMEEATLPES